MVAGTTYNAETSGFRDCTCAFIPVNLVITPNIPIIKFIRVGLTTTRLLLGEIALQHVQCSCDCILRLNLLGMLVINSTHRELPIRTTSSVLRSILHLALQSQVISTSSSKTILFVILLSHSTAKMNLVQVLEVIAVLPLTILVMIQSYSHSSLP